MRFIVPMRPVAWARARRSGNRYFNADRHEDAIEELRWIFLSGHYGKPLTCAVSVKIIFYFRGKIQKTGVTKGDSELVKQWKPTRPDLDNLVKLVADAMTDTLIEDDEQICELYAAKKVHADKDEIEIEVVSLDAEKR